MAGKKGKLENFLSAWHVGLGLWRWRRNRIFWAGFEFECCYLREFFCHLLEQYLAPCKWLLLGLAGVVLGCDGFKGVGEENGYWGVLVIT